MANLIQCFKDHKNNVFFYIQSINMDGNSFLSPHLQEYRATELLIHERVMYFCSILDKRRECGDLVQIVQNYTDTQIIL